MKILTFALLGVSVLCVQAETFKEFTDSVPLGTAKQDIAARWPDAHVVQCMYKPISASHTNECLVLMRRHEGFVASFCFVEGKLAAMILARAVMPGQSLNPE